MSIHDRARSLTILALGLLVAIAPNALAQTVSSETDVFNYGALTQVNDGPTSTADTAAGQSILDAFNLTFDREGAVRASQTRNGFGAVMAEAIFANGDPVNYAQAQTMWTDSATNTTGSPITYEFSYIIAPPQLRLADYAGASAGQPGAPEASFELEIISNGSVVYASSAVLEGGFNGHLLTEAGTSLNPAYVPGSSIFGYDFDGAVGNILLGTFNPGETVTVVYRMLARVETAGYELGGRAAVGDPFDLSGNPGFEGVFRGDGVVAADQSSWGAVKSLY